MTARGTVQIVAVSIHRRGAHVGRDSLAEAGQRSDVDRQDADAALDGLLRAVARPSQPFASGPSLRPGSTLAGGRFAIVRPLGRGGMGVVYEAFDRERDAKVALKTLNRLEPSGLYCLKHEFRALSHLSHPNLVRLHDLYADGEHWFFTMELIRGQPFDRWVRPMANDGGEPQPDRDPFDEARLRSALAQLLAGIEAVHAAGKLHRDLKPSNVLVTPEGRTVLLDFGLVADPQPGGIGQTLHDGGISGTPAYMAPEQAAGAAASTASDLYALGVMLFEALSGRLPFTGQVHQLLADKERRDPPALLDSCPRAPRDLAACCDALLRRDPGARPDAAALRVAWGASAQPSAPLRAPREALLGREREHAILHDALRASCAERAVVVFVHGESGIGKSALLAAALEPLRADGQTAVLAGRCYERESVPFKGLDSLVDELSRVLRTLPAEQVAALLPRDVHALARTFPVLERVEAVACAPGRRGGTPQELRARAFGALCELLARIRDRQPLVLYIDDAQWLDGDGLALLEFLLGQREPVPLLLVLALRSNDEQTQPPLTRLQRRAHDNPALCAIDLALGPLPANAARELAQRLGCDDAAARERLAAESLGSPFLLHELTARFRAARHSGLTLHEALLEHVQSCSPAAQRVMEVLALAARPLPVGHALAAAEAGHEQLDELLAARLLATGGSAQARVLACYHDKIRESIAQALGPERARTLHARLFATLRAASESDAEHLALHAEGAGDRAAAARYGVLAGDAASAAMAFERAASLYQRALELGEHDESARRALQRKLADALANAGRGPEAAQAFLAAAAGLSEPDAFEHKRRAAEQLLLSGHIDEGKALLQEVLRAVGVRLPATPRRALLALGLERARLSLRGLSFRPRSTPLPAAQLRELDALEAASNLNGIDLFAGACLNARFARRALDSGSTRHAAIGLSLVGYALAPERGARAAGEVEALFARGEALAHTSAARDAQALLGFFRAVAGQFLGEDLQRLAGRCAQTIELLADVPGGWQMRCVVRAVLNTACEQSGRLLSVAELSSQVDDAFRRGDLYSAIVLLNSGVTSRMWQGDAKDVARQLAQARQAWRRPRFFSFPDFGLLMAEVSYALHMDQPRHALTLLQDAWPALQRAELLRVPLLRFALLGRRALATFRCAELEPEHEKPLRKLANQDVRVAEGMKLPRMEGPQHSLASIRAYDEQRLDDAHAHLRAAIAHSEQSGWLTHAAAARLRLGEWLGGDEGTALRAQGEAVARAMGITDVQALIRLG